MKPTIIFIIRFFSETLYLRFNITAGGIKPEEKSQIVTEKFNWTMIGVFNLKLQTIGILIGK